MMDRMLSFADVSIGGGILGFLLLVLIILGIVWLIRRV